MAANKTLLQNAFVINMNGNTINIDQSFSDTKVAINILEKVMQSVTPEEAEVLEKAMNVLYKHERENNN